MPQGLKPGARRSQARRRRREMEGSRPLQYSLFDDLPPSAPGRATTVSVSDAAAGRRSAAATSLPLRIAVLGSGSGGNCVVVDSGGRRLLLDAGFSCREIERRLRTLGIEPASLDGVVLTHEHGDHARGAERLVRRHGLPVHATSGTLAAGVLGRQTGKAGVVVSGRPFEVGGFLVEAFTVPHDAREPVGLVVEDGAGRRVGLVADLGARSQLAWARLREVSVLLLETNHDLEMLRSGPYPWSLKQRVAGRHGHLSNREAAEAIEELAGERLELVVLYHLSQTNNLPALAAASVGEALEGAGSRARMIVAEQAEPSEWMEARGA